MPRPGPDEIDAVRERQFNELGLQARTDVAQARNIRARMLTKRDAYLQESVMFKTMVGRLHRQHGLTPNRIALLLDLSRDRIIDILDKQGRKGVKR